LFQTNPIKVQIYEDNKHLLEGLVFIIENDPELMCCGAYENCNDLLIRLEEDKPDVVLLDIEMPGVNGIDGVRLLKSSYPNIQVLMQTVFQDDDHIFNAVCAGASGYLLKSAKSEQYIQAVKDVYRGGSQMSGTVARKVFDLLQKSAAEPLKNDYKLTSKEKEVFGALIEGMSFKMIADALDISYETVRTHMKNIYAKLHVRNNTEAVIKALKERIL
jgi:DNA-binding NarL/FixJ family response regulator